MLVILLYQRLARPMPQAAPEAPLDDLYGVSRLLHTLVLLLQRLPEGQARNGHAAFFDAVHALMIDVCARAPSEQAAQDTLVLVAIGQLERRPLGHDPLVHDLLQVLRRHGFLAGERGTRLASHLRRLVDRHLALFWQESEAPQRPASALRSERPVVVQWNTINLPWHLRPGQRAAAAAAAAHSLAEQPTRHRGAADTWSTMTEPCTAAPSPNH